MRLLFVVAMLLATFGAIEVMARLTCHFLYGECAGGLSAAEPAQAVGQSATEEDAPFGVGRQRGARHFEEQMSFLHPFYGYVSKELADDRPFKPGQRRGKDVALPRRGQDDALVLAILGGSVADDVAGELSAALLRHLPVPRADPGSHPKPILVNLANPGYHQPQQAMVLANQVATGARLDIVVNLDANERLVDASPLANGREQESFAEAAG